MRIHGVCGLIALALAACTSNGSSGTDVQLEVYVNGSGSVTSSPTGIACGAAGGSCLLMAPAGTAVTLTAASGSGDAFAGWTGACSGSTTTCTVQLTSSTTEPTATATFLPVSTSLAVLFAGSGSGSVTAPSAGLSCATGDASCSAALLPGTSVELTAAPDGSSLFAGWSGGCTGDAAACSTTIGSGLDTVTARFEPSTDTLTVDMTGQGAITATGADIDCVDGTGTCSASVPFGATVTLHATPATDWSFAQWDGSDGVCTDDVGACEITLDGALTVTPVFTQNAELLAVSFEGSGSGEVVVTSSACTGDCFDCPSGACSQSFDEGTIVTLTATPGPGSKFTGWSGPCPITGTGPCTLTLDEFQSIVATFDDLPEDLTVELAGPGSGRVTATGYVDCIGGSGTTCSQTVPANTQIVMEAVPSATSTFTGWTGACSGSGWICEVDLTAAATVTAEFALANFTLAVSLPDVYFLDGDTIGAGSTADSGTVVGTGPDGSAVIACGEGGSACSVTLPAYSQITLTGTPSGSNHLEWWGDACDDSGSATCTVTLTSNTNLDALFSTVQVDALSVQVGGGGEGVDVLYVPESADLGTCGGDCTYFIQSGAELDLSAYADPDSDDIFEDWEGGCAGADPYCEFTLTGDVSVYAEFEDDGSD